MSIPSESVGINQSNQSKAKVVPKTNKAGRGKSRETSSRHTRTWHSGLVFSVGRTHRALKQGRYARRVGAGAPVYLASVLEYTIAEILELAGNASKDNKKKRIVPRHIQLAVLNDSELGKLFKDSIISEGGVLPYIHDVLLPRTGRKSGKANGVHNE